MITYISIDIETDGPLIGTNSMLSLGAAAFSWEMKEPKKSYSSFEVNLHPLMNGVQDPKTMSEFWEKNPKAWKLATTNQLDPDEAIYKFMNWYDSLTGKKIIAAYPSCFDFAWLRNYVILFTGKDSLGHESLDIKSLASGILKKPFNEVKTSKMPDSWRDKRSRVAHKAIDDAIAQGVLLMNMLEELGLSS